MLIKLKIFFQTIRYKHWIKNIFVFFPSFFGQNILSTCKDPHLWSTFISFCLAASISYLVNDWTDLETDRMHPKNRIRPIASGQFPLGNILPLIFFLTVVLIILLWNSRIIWPVLVYLIINLGYSLGSKSIPVLDILIISAGFILRVWAGALASHVPLSYWLILMTILSSCFLALGKRKAELEMQVENIINLRPSLTFYKLKWINPGMKIIAVISCGAYVLYCISGAVMTRFGNRHIYFTAIFVILGFIRYYRVTSGKYVYSDPTDLVWHDHLMQFILVGWITCFYLLIY